MSSNAMFGAKRIDPEKKYQNFDGSDIAPEK